jgi:predicted dehydrogenase
METKVSIIGCGYWGKNLIRNYFELDSLYSVCDENPEIAGNFSSTYKCKSQSIEEIINDSSIDGVVIAAPAQSHASLACRILEANKHVFVEKPLALTLEDAFAIKDSLRRSNSDLMVGHLLQYHPGFKLLKDLALSGKFGKIKNILSRRSSFGRIRRNEDVLWSFAPHDISMVLALSQKMPKKVSRFDQSFLQSNLADISNLFLEFDEFHASISVSWIHHKKEQLLKVVCDDALLVFDDTLPWSEKVSVKTFDLINNEKDISLIETETHYHPLPENTEPLKIECMHFLDLIHERIDSLTNIDEGIAVLEVLNSAKFKKS